MTLDWRLVEKELFDILRKAGARCYQREGNYYIKTPEVFYGSGENETSLTMVARELSNRLGKK